MISYYEVKHKSGRKREEAAEHFINLHMSMQMEHTICVCSDVVPFRVSWSRHDLCRKFPEQEPVVIVSMGIILRQRYQIVQLLLPLLDFVLVLETRRKRGY
jgi:hypothetical protein